MTFPDRRPRRDRSITSAAEDVAASRLRLESAHLAIVALDLPLRCRRHDRIAAWGRRIGGGCGTCHLVEIGKAAAEVIKAARVVMDDAEAAARRVTDVTGGSGGRQGFGTYEDL